MRARSGNNNPTPGGVSRGRPCRRIRRFRRSRRFRMKIRRFRTGFSGKSEDPGPKISENPENSEFPDDFEPIFGSIFKVFPRHASTRCAKGRTSVFAAMRGTKRGLRILRYTEKSAKFDEKSLRRRCANESNQKKTMFPLPEVIWHRLWSILIASGSLPASPGMLPGSPGRSRSAPGHSRDASGRPPERPREAPDAPETRLRHPDRPGIDFRVILGRL